MEEQNVVQEMSEDVKKNVENVVEKAPVVGKYAAFEKAAVNRKPVVAKPKSSTASTASTALGATVAVLRVRGLVRVDRDVEATLRFLHLHQKNVCSLHKKSPSLLGMLKKVKDYVTWGEVDDATVTALFDKRGEEYLGKGPSAGKDGKSKSKLSYASRYVEHKAIKNILDLQIQKEGLIGKVLKRLMLSLVF